MFEIKLIESLESIHADAWNALAGTQPFLRHEFLSALQISGCVSPKTGWMPRHLTLWNDGKLVGAMPLYLKSHSRGEFVFDHSWAEAFERNGLSYFPKLLCAVPFTPVAGPRLLAEFPEHRAILIQGALELARRLEVSSLHILFPQESDRKLLQEMGFMLREGVQFHWRNAGYGDFGEFLSALNHEKRKKIQRERRRVLEAGISFRWLRGGEIDDGHLEFFHRCYENTYHEHWSSPYLSLDFFRRIAGAMPDKLLLILAQRDDRPVACALDVIGEGALYGRYWGAVEFVSGLHFETCYCQSIEFCIVHGLGRFEGGAQGVHKVARGLLPTPTWSAHWIADGRFAEAIGRFLEDETTAIEHFREELETHTPFKSSDRASR